MLWLSLETIVIVTVRDIIVYMDHNHMIVQGSCQAGTVYPVIQTFLHSALYPL